MANGAAGCGYEHRNIYDLPTCGRLLREGQEGRYKFTCTKYEVELEKHRTTGEPFRCKECTDNVK